MRDNRTIGITGAGGALGRALTKQFRSKGYKVIGFTHNKTLQEKSDEGPNEWAYWECGKEYLLKNKLKEIDILILNHGIYKFDNDNSNYEDSIEINALSKFKILDIYEQIAQQKENANTKKEIWINTSEAELLPALNPSYEISKLLIGQLVTFKNSLSKINKKNFLIRKLIIGPFKSSLNPIGLMSPDLVAFFIYYLSKMNLFLIIVTPNPLSYILFPLKEFYYLIYCKFLETLKKND